MNILIAPDSFKESLTALEVSTAIEKGFQKVFPDAKYFKIPMADGGEGTTQSLVDATQGKFTKCKVTGPLGEKIDSFIGLSKDKKTAFIEMSAASGLDLVPKDKRNPLKATSFGTGELILKALDEGVKHIILGLGGSATNDGGVGMLQALGAKFLDKNQQPINYGGESLADIKSIELNTLDKRLKGVEIKVACDVDTKLCGKNGATAVFGPQKGADKKMLKTLDNALAHFAHCVQQEIKLDIKTPKGSGAAGGMGAGLLLLPNVKLQQGVEIITQYVELEKYVQIADLILTGEGKLDNQSIYGKTPIGVSRIAKKYGKPVIAIVGATAKDYEAVYEEGINAVFPIIQQLDSLENLLSKGAENITKTARNIAKLYASLKI